MIPKDQYGPEKIIEVYDPANGMQGFLVIDNTTLGPGKGGFRMTPNTSREEVARLARVMTWKNAFFELPFGGAKGGIVWNKGEESQKKEYVESFARALDPLVPCEYITAPDVNTGEEEMRWFVEAIDKFRGATGKPEDMHKVIEGKDYSGLPHEIGSTGFGVAHAAKAAIEYKELNIKDTTVAVHGFGNVGSFAFKFLKDMGAKIVAVADSKTCVYDKNGLSDDIFEFASKDARLNEYKGGEHLESNELFALDVDVLVPASVTDVINKGNKDDIKASIIVEGANIPMSDGVEEELVMRDVVVIPDFVANAGGVIASYAEYEGYSIEDAFKLIEDKMKDKISIILSRVDDDNKDMREIALGLAKEKLLERKKLTLSV